MSNENEELAKRLLHHAERLKWNTAAFDDIAADCKLAAAALSRSGPSEEEVDAALYIVRLVEQRQVDANAKGVMVARAVLRMAGKP